MRLELAQFLDRDVWRFTQSSKELEMSQVLVVYGTKYGQSRRIAEVVAEEFRLLGHRVDLFDVQEIPRGHSPQGYDVV